MNKELTIIDDTLRDWEQQVGVNFSAKSKIKLAHDILDIWVSWITIMPNISSHEMKISKKLISKWFSKYLYAATMLDKKYVDKMAEIWFKKIILFASISKILLKTKGISEEDNFNKIKNTVSYAKKKWLKIIFAWEDSTRADIKYLIKVIKSIEKNIEGFLICDTVWILKPESTKLLIRKILKQVKCKIWTHFHNDSWLALKNAIVWIQEWANILSWTIWGIWERAWNVDIIEILRTLQKENIFIKWIKYKKLEKLKNKVYKLWWSRPANPYSKKAFYHESWIHVASLIKNGLSYNWTNPKKYWYKNTFFFGKYAWISNYKYIFKNKYSDSQLLKIRDYIKDLAHKENKSYSEKDIIKIVKNIPLGNTSSANDKYTWAYFKKNSLTYSKEMFSKKRLSWFFLEFNNLFKNNRKKTIKILDIWAWTWFIWDNTKKYFIKQWYNVKILYSDINIKFLKWKTNVYELDNKNLNKIKSWSIDIVVGGSVLHYEEKIEHQYLALKEINRILKNNWLFIYQWMTCQTQREKDFFSFIGRLAWRKQSLHTSKERENLYKKSWFNIINIRQDDFICKQSDSDYFKRFFINKKDIISNIRDKIIFKIKNNWKYKWVYLNKGNFERNIYYNLFILKKISS